MENDFQVEQDQPNFWVGLIVAIVLGLAGSVVWAFVYLLGYIAWIVAFFMIFIMAWGYKKFNLKMDVKGYVLITIFAILETLLALVFVMAFLGMSEEVSFGEAFLLSFQMLFSDTAFIIDAVLSGIAIIVATVFHYFTEKNKDKKLNEKKDGNVVDVKPVEVKNTQQAQDKQVKTDNKQEENNKAESEENASSQTENNNPSEQSENEENKK